MNTNQNRKHLTGSFPGPGKHLLSKAGDPVAELFGHAVRRQAAGRSDEAIAAYRKVLQLHPHLAEARYNMGVIYYEQKDRHQAIIQFKKALDLKPDFVDAAFNLAIALRECGEHAKASHIFRMTVQMAPHLAAAHFLQGRCHLSTGEPHLAIHAIDKAVKLEPQNARHWFYLAQARLSIGDVEASLASYRKVTALQPDWDAAHYNLSVALRLAERIEEAIVHAQKAIQINPDYKRALPLLFRLAQHACDWDLAAWASERLDEITCSELQQGIKTTEPPLTSIRRLSDVRANMLVARSWSRDHLMSLRNQSFRPNVKQRNTSDDRIRIGYLSSDFKDHAVAFQIRGLLEKHDRGRFEIFGYACNPDDGTPYRQRLAEACDQFNDVHGLTNLAIAQKLNADGIDILVDMGGHSRDNRLGVAALRPAPVQVSYLGFLSTTGADFIDYVVADPIVVPQAHADFYTEKIIYLPHCYQVNDDRIPISGEPQSRTRWSLPEQAFVYCCFNQPYKIDAALFQAWMNILRQVGHSVLWLVERSELARANLCRAAALAGVDPARLIFTGFVPLDQNLARIQLADLVLDTLTYNGGATTANALWAGVPVLSAMGGHWVSRMTSSALTAVGLGDLIAGNLIEYEQIAVEMALNPLKLQTKRRHLQQQRLKAPLFDTALFTRHLEEAYSYMWQRFSDGLAPVSFQVAP